MVTASGHSAVSAQLPFDLAKLPFSSTRSCFGVCINTRTDTETLLEMIWKGIPSSPYIDTQAAAVDFAIQASREPGSYQVALNGVRLGDEVSLREAIHFVQHRVPEAAALLSKDFVFVHAGVVAWEGEAILVPGRSLTGKSRLVMALVDAGATYYSDEYAVLDTSGRTHAYLRAPTLRENLGVSICSQIAGGIALPVLPVGLILHTRYVDRAVWEPRALSPQEILFALLENTLAIRQKPDICLKTLARISLHADGFASDRDEAQALAHAVLKLRKTKRHITPSEE